MGRFKSEDDFYHGKEESMGVLLANLGTPDAPDAKSVRRFLAEFLSDARVVEIPRLIWLVILYAFVLPRRPAVVAENYKKVWMDEGSPLLVYAQKQQKLLQHELDLRFNGPVHVELGMRYGKPSIQQALLDLKAKGVKRLIVLPLYPQYSATTSATVFDAVMNELKTWRWVPELRWVNQYHDHDAYIQALVEQVKEHWQETDRPDKLVMSFHGLPERNLQLGDPYHCQCYKTARLVAEKLGIKKDEWIVTFQSRFGKAEWLKPYTEKTLEELPAQGVKDIDVICPGFSADCLETLEEINIGIRETFINAGGTKFDYIPALNERPAHIMALADVIQEQTLGWVETDSSWNKDRLLKTAEKTRKLAMDLGAKV